MITHEVQSFHDFHDIIHGYRRDRRWIFRGHNSLSWDLVPKIGREEYNILERNAYFESFKRRAIEFTAIQPIDEWDWIAFAQHHGLPTPLLDWSYNPLVAAYFATYPFSQADCCVYAFRPVNALTTDEVAPETFEGVAKFVPRGVAQRIVRQGGIFTYHNPPQTKLEDGLKSNDRLEKIVIKESYRQNMVFDLDRYCVNEMTLFPDIDGLSRYMAWSGRSDVRSYWTNCGKKEPDLTVEAPAGLRSD